MRRNNVIAFALVAVFLGMTDYAVAQAVSCPGAGLIIVQRFEIAPNPVLIGQNGGALVILKNKTSSTQIASSVIMEVLSEGGEVLLQVFNLTGIAVANTQFLVLPFATAGMTGPFTGFVRVTIKVGGVCTDTVTLPLRIEASCPLTSPILPYVAPN